MWNCGASTLAYTYTCLVFILDYFELCCKLLGLRSHDAADKKSAATIGSKTANPTAQSCTNIGRTHVGGGST